jgi:hypothetical protein
MATHVPQSDKRFRSYNRWKLSVLLEISVWIEESDLSTLEFGPKWSEIVENSEYQSDREFHKLSKEDENSEFRYRTNEERRIEAERIFEIRLQIRIDFF